MPRRARHDRDGVSDVVRTARRPARSGRSAWVSTRRRPAAWHASSATGTASCLPADIPFCARRMAGCSTPAIATVSPCSSVGRTCPVLWPAGRRGGIAPFRRTSPPILRDCNDLCAEDVPVEAAALQFPLRHPAVAAVVTGMRSAAGGGAECAALAAAIPAAFWERLAGAGFVRPGTACIDAHQHFWHLARGDYSFPRPETPCSIANSPLTTLRRS